MDYRLNTYFAKTPSFCELCNLWVFFQIFLWVISSNVVDFLSLKKSKTPGKLEVNLVHLALEWAWAWAVWAAWAWAQASWWIGEWMWAAWHGCEWHDWSVHRPLIFYLKLSVWVEFKQKMCDFYVILRRVAKISLDLFRTKVSFARMIQNRHGSNWLTPKR